MQPHASTIKKSKKDISVLVNEDDVKRLEVNYFLQKETCANCDVYF